VSLLAPLALLLGLSAAVPLWLHLRHRKVEMRVEFPGVRYLLRAEQEHARELKVRNVLLMLLRVAIVLLVALAAASPMARFGVVGHGPTALAVVLDNSMSTGAVVNGRSVLADLLPATKPRQITSDLILDETAKQFGWTIEDLCGKSRRRPLVNARQIGMYVMRELTDFSYPRIAEVFGGRDHTTVMYAVDKIRGQMTERHHTFEQVTELIARVRLGSSS